MVYHSIKSFLKKSGVSSVALCLLTAAVMTTGCTHGPKRVEELTDVTVQPWEDHPFQIILKNDTLSGLADLEGNIILQPEYRGIKFKKDTVTNEFFFVTINEENKCGAFDDKGKNIVPEKYDGMDFFIGGDLDGFYVLKNYTTGDTYEINGHKIVDDEQHTKWGVFDMNGKELVPCDFELVSYEGNGYFSVITPRVKGEPGLEGLYKDGEKVIPAKYNSLSVSGSANGALGVISNEKGNSKLDKYFVFDLTDGAKKSKFLWGDKAWVSDNFVITESVLNNLFTQAAYDFKGNIKIAPGNYQRISEKKGMFICNQAGSGGHSKLLNSAIQTVFEDENIVLGFDFDDTPLIKAHNRATGKYGAVDFKGNWYIPCEYNSIKVKDGKIKAYRGGGRNSVEDEFPLPE